MDISMCNMNLYNVSQSVSCSNILHIHKTVCNRMSVYDRATRPTVKPIGSTGLHVGPGSYDVEVTDKSKIRSGTY